jgi:acyl phosphate:glycerol-3-phosphate acyltransferase
MIIPDLVKILISIVTGYLIGSFLPGYFLPLWFKGMDIRKMGDGNPGLINVKKSAGNFAALLTALYDLPKGLLSVYIIYGVLKFPLSFAYLAGFSAVIGHKFPFYLGFKGGRGIAATVGLFIFILLRILIQNFTFMEFLPFAVYIAIFALLLTLATHRKGDLFTVFIFPFIGIFMLIKLHVSPEMVFILALIFIMTMEASRNLTRDEIKFHAEGYIWRTIARPCALLLIPLGIFLPKISLIILIGCVLAVFFIMDLLRNNDQKVEQFFQNESRRRIKIFKPEEVGKISSMTIFLLGIFICFITFDRNIAFASVGFSSLAVIFGQVVDMNFGKRKLLSGSEKTLEGSLAFLGAALTISFFLWISGYLPFHIAIIGALVAMITDALPTRVDPDFSIPVISAAIMALFQNGL